MGHNALENENNGGVQSWRLKSWRVAKRNEARYLITWEMRRRHSR